MNCRFCKKELKTTFLDLGYAPPTNAFRSNLDLKKPEVNYPLKIMVCKSCWLVQTVDYVDADMLFNPDYAYFSSTSSSWLKHCQKFVEGISKQLVLNKSSFVIEVASKAYRSRSIVIASKSSHRNRNAYGKHMNITSSRWP